VKHDGPGQEAERDPARPRQTVERIGGEGPDYEHEGGAGRGYDDAVPDVRDEIGAAAEQDILVVVEGGREDPCAGVDGDLVLERLDRDPHERTDDDQHSEREQTIPHETFALAERGHTLVLLVKACRLTRRKATMAAITASDSMAP
jgi:hypothetical protein